MTFQAQNQPQRQPNVKTSLIKTCKALPHCMLTLEENTCGERQSSRISARTLLTPKSQLMIATAKGTFVQTDTFSTTVNLCYATCRPCERTKALHVSQ